MFKEKVTLIENMTFMGIVAAINVICSLLGAFFPIAGIFIMIFLPFLSAAVALVCKWKYYPIYFFASIGVALAATFFNTQYTVFYLIPSLITGFVFGFCFKKHLSASYAILFASIIQLGVSYIFIPLINLIYSCDLIQQFLILFHLNTKQDSRIIIPSFIFLLSAIQMVLTFIVLNNELEKFKQNNWSNNNKYLYIIGAGFSVLLIPFVFFRATLSIAYLFMFISLFISINAFINLIIKFKTKPWIIAILSILMASGFLSIFIFYNFVKMPYTLLLINVSNISIFIITLVYNLKREEILC